MNALPYMSQSNRMVEESQMNILSYNYFLIVRSLNVSLLITD